MAYNWQLKGWPEFVYEIGHLEPLLHSFGAKAGLTGGMVAAMPDAERNNALIDIMVTEAIKTSAIEGELLSREDVLSSVKNNLGLGQNTVHDVRARGVADLMRMVRDQFQEPLSEKILWDWHTQLMRGSRNVQVGCWRTHAEPMQIISGPAGREIVHFEAPPSSRVAKEMSTFLDWFNATAPDGISPLLHAPVRAAVAHVYFESIHPFEDGNGRIGRAVAEKALSQGVGFPVILSLSTAIEARRAEYYEALKVAQRSLRITSWVEYFLSICVEAQKHAQDLVEFTLRKARFLDQYDECLNPRQRKVILRMLAEGPQGFEGGMTARKYIAMTRVSKATATRDLVYLERAGLLKAVGGGRSTRYELNLQLSSGEARSAD